MKKILTVLSLTLLMGQSASLTSLAFAATYDEACKHNKPVVLLITAPLCGACKQFEPFFKQAESKFASKFSFAKENISGSKIANQLNVNETPSVFIMEPNTNKKQRIQWECLSSQGCFEDKLQNY